ncbi:MAG: FtsX-like permease family protein [Calditrichaeota bacterium]|nr:MAG: FtsX-like permease family protein [Calditrichota bacterium]
MLTIKLAMRNILGAGLKTWLNVAVLSIAFVTIIYTQGIYLGMNEQASTALVKVYYGGGQYWQKDYDPYDSFSLEESHAPLTPELETFVQQDQATPILCALATAFQGSRIIPVQLKGIPPDQKILDLPTAALNDETEMIPALIGTRMAKSAQLNVGDLLTIRWRDVHGVYDAADVKIVHIMRTTVSTIDASVLWLPLQQMQKMYDLQDEATLAVLTQTVQPVAVTADWRFVPPEELLADIKEMVQQKTIAASIMYVLLLFLGLIAVFDTQVLAVFRRRREIGTLIALGMTRARVIKIFTLEGILNGLLALLVGALWGAPLIWMFARSGMAMPDFVDNMGIAIGERIYPVYGAGLILGTSILVMISVAIVSFMPTRSISHLSPTDALKGKHR